MMYQRAASAIGEYQHIKTQYDVESASPHRLIQMLMERIIAKISMARGHMQREDVSNKGRLIGDAIDIISGLQASLNHKADETIAGNFDALYDYMKRRLLLANLHNDAEILSEVSGLMLELKEAWDAIAGEVPAGDVELQGNRSS